MSKLPHEHQAAPLDLPASPVDDDVDRPEIANLPHEKLEQIEVCRGCGGAGVPDSGAAAGDCDRIKPWEQTTLQTILPCTPRPPFGGGWGGL